MRVSINQPAFLPWLGYFHRIAVSDLHIVLDHVQFEKNSYTNRNKIKTCNDSIWLTVPVITSGRFGNIAINKIEISNQTKWQKKIIETVKQFYRKAPFFNDYFPFLEETILAHEWLLLIDLIKTLNKYFLEELSITTEIKYSSELNIPGTKSELVLNFCENVGCQTYISGPFGKDYLNKNAFEDKNINIVFHEYKHPQYVQIQSGFTPNLSIIDLLFNYGKQSKEILMQG